METGMDLKDFLRDVFPNKDDEKLSRMLENLKRLGFDSAADLKLFDEEAAKELDSFNRIEIRMLKTRLENFEFETLEEILSMILGGTNMSRIEEIKTFLNQRKIYSRKDVLVINIRIMKMAEFFSDDELLKIESFLEKNNREFYYEMVTGKNFHKSDLVPCLYEIFRGSDTKRISEIEDILNGQSITAKKDLVYIDTKKLKREKILSEVEVLKIDSFLQQNYKDKLDDIKKAREVEESKNLKHVLNEIFYGTSEDRLETIENIIKKEEIYSGKDILFINLNSPQLKQSLTDAEMLKLEDYLKKENLEHYEKIMADRKLEKSRNLKDVLKEIFVERPEHRIAEIEIILKEEQIYSGLDLMIADTNDLRKKSLSNINCLSNIEILKIEEYIRKNNKERYEEIRLVKMAEGERKLIQLKAKDEIEVYKLKEEEKLKFTILNAQEEQKMYEFKMHEERKLKERELEFTSAKAKEDMEREIIMKQREREVEEAEEKSKIQRQIEEKCWQSLLKEKERLMDEIRSLENDCIRLKKLITETEGQTGFWGFGASSEADKKKLRDERKEKKKILELRKIRLTEIDEELKAKTGFQ